MLNADQSQKAKELGKVFKAMAKLMCREENHLKLCCICITKGSHTAVVTDGGLSLTAVNVSAFEQSAYDNLVTAYELAAFYAGLKMIEYTNSFVFVSAKMYEKFISLFTDGLASINTNDFEYFNWVKHIPNWENLTSEIKGVYDPKIITLVNKVFDAYFDGHQEHFEDRVYENKNHTVGLVMFDNLAFSMIFAKRFGEDHVKAPLGREDFEDIKKLENYFNHESEVPED